MPGELFGAEAPCEVSGKAARENLQIDLYTMTSSIDKNRYGKTVR